VARLSGTTGVSSFPPLLRFVWFLDRWGRRGPHSTLRRPFWPPPRPPRFPQGPFREPKCTILYNKTNDFAKPSVCQKCPLRTPLGPPRLPQGPPRAPQGRTRAPQGVPQEPLGEPGAPQGPPQRPPSTPQESPKATQRNPRSLWEGLGPAKGTPRSPGAPPRRSCRATSDGTRLEHEAEKGRQQ
jgi:hypothetical protein